MTTLLFLMSITLVIVGMVVVINQVAFVKTSQNALIQEQLDKTSFVQQFMSCYGLVFHEDRYLADENCIRFSENEGIAIDVLDYGECEDYKVTALPYSGSGRVDIYPISFYNPEQDIVCPALLKYYEDKELVPLVTKLRMPRVALEGNDVSLEIDAFQKEEPSTLELFVYNATGEIVYTLLQAVSGLDKITIGPLVIPSSSLMPGEHIVEARAYYQPNVFDRLLKGIFIIPSDTAPVLMSFLMEPEEGTIEDIYYFEAKLRDYVNITDVYLVLDDGQSVIVPRINMSRVNKGPLDDYITWYDYRASFDAMVLPDVNQSYNVSLVAFNELGNQLIVPDVRTLKITERPIDPFKLVVVPISYNFPSDRTRYSTHAQTFGNHFLDTSPLRECVPKEEHIQILELSEDCAAAVNPCSELFGGFPCDAACHMAVINCAKDEYPEFDKAEGIYDGQISYYGIIGCAGISNLGVPPHLGSQQGGAIHTVVGNADGSGSSHELGHDFGLCHTINLARPDLCPNSDAAFQNCIMDYGNIKDHYCTDAYAHLRQHPYLIHALRGCI